MSTILNVEYRNEGTDILKHSMIYRLIRYSFFIFVTYAVFGCAVFSTTHWDGDSEWTFKVSVNDQNTSSPIENATVSIIVKNETPFGEIESFVHVKDSNHCITDRKGECELTTKFNTYGTKSFWKSEAYINFRHRNISVEAKGYRALSVPLKEYIKTPHELPPVEKRGQPSVIKIIMNKSGEPKKNGINMTKRNESRNPHNH